MTLAAFRKFFVGNSLGNAAISKGRRYLRVTCRKESNDVFAKAANALNRIEDDGDRLERGMIHHEMLKYYQTTGNVGGEVLSNLTV